MVEQDTTPVDDDSSPQAVEPPAAPSEDLLLKKAIEVVTKGKGEVASSPAADKRGPGDGTQPIVTPLNVPRQPPPQ